MQRPTLVFLLGLSLSTPVASALRDDATKEDEQAVKVGRNGAFQYVANEDMQTGAREFGASMAWIHNALDQLEKEANHHKHGHHHKHHKSRHHQHGHFHPHNALLEESVTQEHGPGGMAMVEVSERPSQDEAHLAAESLSESEVRAKLASMRERLAHAEAAETKADEELKGFRQEVQEMQRLSAEVGEAESAFKAKYQAKAVDQAKAKLQEVAQERATLGNKAEQLDEQMHKEFNTMNAASESTSESDAEAKDRQNRKDYESLMSLKELIRVTSDPKQEAEDKQFAELEQQTKHIMEWFNKLKALRTQRDAMKKKKDDAMAAAANMGSAAEALGQEIKQAGQKTTDSAKLSGNLYAQKSSALMERQQKQKKLEAVMASSAIEIAQIEKSATDVQDGIKEYAQWRENDDGSAQSQEQKIRIQAKLQQAVDFLEKHEKNIDIRRNVIEQMLKQH